MAKIKLTKGELKRERDALTQYKRYLPTLQLKKQQLQLEILNQIAALNEIKKQEQNKREEIMRWSNILRDEKIDIKPWLKPKDIIKDTKNIAGVDIPIFLKAEFERAEYDLFIMPLWVDKAIEALRSLVSVIESIKIAETGISVLRHELRITTQRVNLFEKIKNVRLFAEGERHFEKSIVDSNGDILIVSQFTLYGSCEKGRRPDFGEAAPPEHARKLYEYFVAQCRSTGLTVATGIFGAMMEVDLINDGPVTFLIESKDLPPS